MAVFLAGVLIGLHFLFAASPADQSRGILGGPSPDADPGPVHELGTLVGEAVISTSQAATPAGDEEDIFEEEFLAGSLEDTSPVVGSVPAPATIITYKVRKGDTLSRIAVNFGISQESIRSTNPGLTRSLQIGEELTILPSSGLIYKVVEGDTLQSVAAAASVSEDKIRELNPGIDLVNLIPGGSLVIPSSGHHRSSVASKASTLPNLRGYFVQPAAGFNWGRLHNHNAVDIANSCGSPVAAAAEGVVVTDPNEGDGTDGWNGGYGHFIFIEHPNGTKTRYAHMQEVAVAVGDYVKQGEEIGTMGNSGNTHGVTGCHLHFEVYGAQNPFAR